MHNPLVIFGVIILAGLALDALGRRTRLPRITLLIGFGIVIGSSGFDLLPAAVEGWYETIAQVSLTMIAFLLGGELSAKVLKSYGRPIFLVSLSVTVVSIVIMSLGLLAFGASLALALLLAGIGLATDPAAVRDVVRQGNAEGPFARILLGVVAIDDVWGIVAFSLLLGLAASINGAGMSESLTHGVIDVLGSLLLGSVIGWPAAFLTGRIRSGQPTLAEALGIVLLCAGLAHYFGLSPLLVGMTVGVITVNFAAHHEYPFHEIEYISWPFLILFFVLAGATFELQAALDVGAIGVAFILCRLLARVVGGWIGGRLSGLSGKQSAVVGLSLTPQAGVALGMAIFATELVPEISDSLLAIAVASTVIFELFGPLLTAMALKVAGEWRPGDPATADGPETPSQP